MSIKEKVIACLFGHTALTWLAKFVAAINMLETKITRRNIKFLSLLWMKRVSV
jgi:hypothetical protein